MKCSTKGNGGQEAEQALQGLKDNPIVGQDWEKTQARIGIDLERTARETKALQRKREIRSAKDLLRLILFYAVSDWSLRLSAAWALLSGIGYLSDVALLKRLCNSRVWLGQLVGWVLAQRCSALRQMAGVRVRLLDATCLSHPGSDGTDWRIHVSFDLQQLCMDGIEVTDRHGGETLARFPSRENEIQIADAGYAFAAGMGAVLATGAGLIVRINWRNVAVFDLEGQRFQILPWLRSLTGPCEQPVLFETPQGWVQLRLIAAPLPPEKAEQARRRVRQRYQRKHLPVTQETLLAAGFVLLLTNLPADPWTLRFVLALYRIRWQIELVFKRLKSTLHFDALRAKHPHLAQTYLLAKLLIALMLDQMIQQLAFLQPDWFTAIHRPLNLSRCCVWFFETLRQIIFGSWLTHNLAFFLLLMRRYFCDPPRSRPQQLAWARALFAHLNLSSFTP
jgi:hypothetical protein